MLTTARCTLLAPSIADLEPMSALHADPQTRAFLGGALNHDAAATAARRAIIGTSEDHAWVVRLTGNNQFCGLVTLGPHHDGQGFEISFLFAPQVWGQGIAGESVAGVLVHAQQILGIWPVLAETQQANLSSQRLLARCGMRQIAALHRFGAEQVLYSTTS